MHAHPPTHARTQELEHDRDEEVAAAKERAISAKEIRESLVKELLALSKVLNSAGAAEIRLKRADEDLIRLTRVERELESAKKQIQSGGVVPVRVANEVINHNKGRRESICLTHQSVSHQTIIDTPG